MTPDDPRHGSYAGAINHALTKTPACDPCRQAAAKYKRDRRARHYLNRTDSLEVPAVGTIRRLHALGALGWRMEDLDRERGRAMGTTSRLHRRSGSVVHLATHREIAALYDRLCMTIPDYPLAERQRKIAASRGWLPPLAWDNIDDPDERPTDWQYRGPVRAEGRRESLLEMVDAGMTAQAAADALGLSRNSLNSWCNRYGMADTFATLAAREDRQPNGRSAA